MTPKPNKPVTKSQSPPKAGALGDWREEILARMRALILEADPEMIEERKWKKASTPASHARSCSVAGSRALITITGTPSSAGIAFSRFMTT